MTKGRDRTAESISNLLEVARAQQPSGMLRAEYSQGGHLEEGEIYILAGQPIYARAGKLIGQEAFQRLLGWRKIYYSFVADAPRPRANLTSALHMGNLTPSVTVQLPYPPPFQISAPPSTRSPTTGELRWNPLETQNKFPASRNRAPGIENLVPQKAGPERDAYSLSLSRRQRLVYFMVNGQRSIGDLSRCTNKTMTEVELILNELQEQGLVTIHATDGP
jgi:hypothetical protein